MIYLLLVKVYNKIGSFLHRRLGINLRAQAFSLRGLKKPRICHVGRLRFYFNPKVAGNYTRLIVGEFSEPETHVFLERVLDKVAGTVLFIDVGANIGEFVVHMAAHDRVSSVLGFEPFPEVLKACRLSVALNELDNVQLSEKALAESPGMVRFVFDERLPELSTIQDGDSQKGSLVSASTLDQETEGCKGESIILIDVEGSELRVMKGGRDYIARSRPLLIFEYNQVTRQHFDLDEVRKVLGESYRLYRLRHDGYLDESFKRTWNCVAVHAESPFSEICRTLLR